VWVEIEDGHLAGAVAWRETAGELEILNLAVGPAWRRRGIGRGLMERAMEGLAARGVGRVFLEVRASNAGAQAFYSQLGFAEAGRRRDYYREPAEDALLLSRTL
jgi:ribosomal-protein-alanine N-acetyltransferase